MLTIHCTVHETTFVRTFRQHEDAADWIRSEAEGDVVIFEDARRWTVIEAALWLDSCFLPCVELSLDEYATIGIEYAEKAASQQFYLGW